MASFLLSPPADIFNGTGLSSRESDFFDREILNDFFSSYSGTCSGTGVISSPAWSVLNLAIRDRDFSAILASSYAAFVTSYMLAYCSSLAADTRG